MQIKVLREFAGDYGRKRPGDVFSALDHDARILVHRRLAEPWIPFKAPRQPVREVQAFLGAPEVKCVVAVEPLVSCIIPTADRPALLGAAIRSFQAQTYERKQLLVIDDGRESSLSIVPMNDPTIRYVRFDQKLTIGKKRNLAVQYAAGDFIAHFDDDDVSAPDRIERQVSTLRETGAAVTGYGDVLFIDPKRRLFRMTGEPGYAAGTSLMYRRDWALRNPFPDIQQGEDNGFIERAKNTIVVTSSEDRILARIHQGNTVRKRPGGKGWVRVPKQEFPKWANI